MQRSLTAIIEKEDEMYVSSCPELDIASQGNSIEEAKANLQEAIELYLETASEIKVLSGKSVCGILANHGFKEVRRKGSHIIMQKQIISSTITVPVPDHKEIKMGTLQSIIRQSQVDRKEFE